MTNDMFERADDLRNFGESLLKEDGRFRYQRRAEQEAEDSRSFREFYSQRIDEVPEFAEIMTIGDRFIAEGRARLPPPDGHLGVYKLLREIFGFLTSEFGMLLSPSDIELAIYVSSAVKLELDWPRVSDAYLRIIELAKPDMIYCLEDLLWRAGQHKHFLTWPSPPETTEEARTWFETIAALLKQHASDLLADEPGAFASLAAAAEERERLYVAECERLAIRDHGAPPAPIS